MAITTMSSSDYDKITNTVIAAARYTEEVQNIMRALVTNFTMPQGASTYRVPRFGQLDASALTEGIDITTTEDLAVTYSDFTTSEAGLKVILTDKMMREVTEGMLESTGKVMGAAVARHIDKALLALFDGFSTNTLGATTKKLDEEVIAGAIHILVGSLATRPFAIVHHPYAYDNFIKAVAVAAVSYAYPSGMPEQLVRDHFLMNLKMYGVDMWHDANIVKGTAGGCTAADDAKGAAFSKEALCLTMALEPTAGWTEDKSLRGIELVHVVDYGAAELMDSYGVELYFTAAKPAPTGD